MLPENYNVLLRSLNEEGNDIKDELLTYLKPLIQGEVQIPYENGIPKRFIL